MLICVIFAFVFDLFCSNTSNLMPVNKFNHGFKLVLMVVQPILDCM